LIPNKRGITVVKPTAKGLIEGQVFNRFLILDADLAKK
jgi:hypothetical protein